MTTDAMRQRIEQLYEENPHEYGASDHDSFSAFKTALNHGRLRAAEPDEASATGWRVNEWVKKGILLGFRMGGLVDMSINREKMPWFDKGTYPVKKVGIEDGIRIVPGGTSIRDGCFVGKGVVCMPPSYINVGAWVGEGTMIDSHALVGSCAQVGARCHISAAAQIGGVLEPVGALPVIIEDDVLIGGNCGLYEGTIVRCRAVLGTGTVITRSTPIYDAVNGTIIRPDGDTPIVVPEGAVVVPGARPFEQGKGAEWGLSVYTPIIIKYRDRRTGTKIRLEDLLR